MGLPVIPRSLQQAGNEVVLGGVQYGGINHERQQARQAAENKRAFALAQSQRSSGVPPNGMTGLQYVTGGAGSGAAMGDVLRQSFQGGNQQARMNFPNLVYSGSGSMPYYIDSSTPQTQPRPTQSNPGNGGGSGGNRPPTSRPNSRPRAGNELRGSANDLINNPRVRAFLDTISYSEGADYNTMFGGGTFDDYSRHPDRVIRRNGYSSSAAGRYQFLSSTWNEVARNLGLSDFSPENQDRAAVQLLRRRGALDDVVNGNFDQAVFDSAPEWASLPTRRGRSYYGQPVRALSRLRQVYQQNLQRYGGGM